MQIRVWVNGKLKKYNTSIPKAYRGMTSKAHTSCWGAVAKERSKDGSQKH